jgi:hypothetical protein
MGLGALVELDLQNGKKQVYEHTIYRGYLSSIENVAHFGLGGQNNVKELSIIWPDGKRQVLKNVAANQTLTVKYKDASEEVKNTIAQETMLTEVTDSLNITYVHQEPDFIDFNVQKLLPHKLSQYAPAVSVGDVNGDGLQDFFTGGSRLNKGVFFIQNRKGTFEQKDLLPAPQSGVKEEEDMGTLLFDADGDNDLDLYVASGGTEKGFENPAYQDRLYLNNGKGQFDLAIEALPVAYTSNSCVKAADFDRDGDLDLFVGGRVEPDRYPKPVNSYILRNDSKPGQVKFTDVTDQVAKSLSAIGLVCDVLWTDYDNDGWVDLLLAGEWMPLTVLKNKGGNFENMTQQAGLSNYTGWWNSLAAGDFDNDGDTDYIAGNLGLNSLNKASDEYPLTIYAKDFDGNGSYDAIPTTYFPDQQGKKNEYTFHGREDLIKQMISMRARFPYYKDFAGASLDKLLTAEEKKDALILKSNYLSTSYLENKGDGTFNIKALPVEAQLAPVFGMIVTDIDKDGYLDVLMTGNDFSNEVMMGRYDAFNGLLLKNNGKGGFLPVNMESSGFFVPGNAKALAGFTGPQGQQYMVASQNRDRLCVFKNGKAAESIKLQPNDAFAWITLSDGKKQKEEFYYGHSFLSQSARELIVPENVKQIEIYNYQGNKREVLLQ